MAKKYKVCEGQSFKLALDAKDPEGTVVSYKLAKGSPAGSSIADGKFSWDVTAKVKVSATIEGSDQCGKTTSFVITLAPYQCKCKNGGKCLSDTVDSPECSYSLRCSCPAGFTGKRCEVGQRKGEEIIYGRNNIQHNKINGIAQDEFEIQFVSSEAEVTFKIETDAVGPL